MCGLSYSISAAGDLLSFAGVTVIDALRHEQEIRAARSGSTNLVLRSIRARRRVINRGILNATVRYQSDGPDRERAGFYLDLAEPAELEAGALAPDPHQP